MLSPGVICRIVDFYLLLTSNSSYFPSSIEVDFSPSLSLVLTPSHHTNPPIPQQTHMPPKRKGLTSSSSSSKSPRKTPPSPSSSESLPPPSSTSKKAPSANYCPTLEHVTEKETDLLLSHISDVLKSHNDGNFSNSKEKFVDKFSSLQLFNTKKRAGCPTLLLHILEGRVPLDTSDMVLVIGMCPKITRDGKSADLNTDEAFSGNCIQTAYR